MNLKALRSAAALSFSVALGGVMFAQGTPSPSGQSGTTPRQGSQEGQTVTVTGCLVRASDLPGQAGAPSGGATAGASDFVLSNVQMRSTSPSGTTGGTTAGGTTAGTTGGTTAGTTAGGAATEASGAKGMNLKLSGTGSEKFSEHVNKQVEVTGRLSMSGAGATSGATGAAGTTGAPGTTGTTGAPGTTGATGTTGAAAGRAASGAAGQMGQLQVQSIRETGQACTPSGK